MSTPFLVNVFSNQHHRLNSETTTIGRSTSSDIILKDILVSRTHAIVRCIDGAFFLEDNASTNGTMHNEEVVVACKPLKSGDTIRIGTTWFHFELEDSSDYDTTQSPVHSSRTKTPYGLPVDALPCNLKTLLRQFSTKIRAAC